ncbi:MAG: 16S rRNA (guanine(966)-N(2))-methyltransferase RsmD [Hyphomicrobium sp.]
MRIVAGRFRGRSLATPDHDGLRPTSDRVRESVFNVLAHGVDGFTLTGCRVIDLFAGTGALGLEAVSRGAAYCLFVDDSADARALIRRNIETFGLTGETRIFRRDATDLGPAGTMDRYDLAFLDPPYDKGLAEKALAALAAGKWLTPSAIVVVEERADTPLAVPAAFEHITTRSWGDTEVKILRYAPG